MNEAQRKDIMLRAAQHTGFAMYQMTTGNLEAAMSGLDVAKLRMQQLIDDDRAERREYENDIMAGDEKSEVHEDD